MQPPNAFYYCFSFLCCMLFYFSFYFALFLLSVLKCERKIRRLFYELNTRINTHEQTHKTENSCMRLNVIVVLIFGFLSFFVFFRWGSCFFCTVSAIIFMIWELSIIFACKSTIRKVYFIHRNSEIYGAYFMLFDLFQGNIFIVPE